MITIPCASKRTVIIEDLSIILDGDTATITPTAEDLPQ